MTICPRCGRGYNKDKLIEEGKSQAKKCDWCDCDAQNHLCHACFYVLRKSIENEARREFIEMIDKWFNKDFGNLKDSISTKKGCGELRPFSRPSWGVIRCGEGGYLCYKCENDRLEAKREDKAK